MADRAEAEREVYMVRSNIIKEFTDITMTEESTAIHLLEKYQWNITEALNSYFSSSHNDSIVEVLDMNEESGTQANPIMIDSSPIGKTLGASNDKGEQKSKINHLKLLTWNVDGLSEHQIEERTRYVCEFINTRKPDVVFLQEVIEDTLKAFCSRCEGFSTLSARRTFRYFNAMMLRDQNVKPLEPLNEVYFAQSTMGRHLLIQPVLFNQQAKLVLMTSHLESNKECRQERMRQLQIVFDKMLQQEPEYTVVFGGDANLRDTEVQQVGLPTEISDAWEKCGEDEATKFTWDVSVNDNLEWPFPNKPKLRFDRIYVRPGTGNSKLEPSEFSLVGKQRLASGCYPSDHWGIWCNFENK